MSWVSRGMQTSLADLPTCWLGEESEKAPDWHRVSKDLMEARAAARCVRDMGHRGDGQQAAGGVWLWEERIWHLELTAEGPLALVTSGHPKCYKPAVLNWP